MSCSLYIHRCEVVGGAPDLSGEIPHPGRQACVDQLPGEAWSEEGDSCGEDHREDSQGEI